VVQSAKSRPGTYSAHRTRQRRRILEAARALFDAQGIDRVSMATITAKSGLQPSTIYQYFSGKDAIVAALVGEIFSLGAERLHVRLNATPTAYEKIAAILDMLAEELTEHPEDVRFMAEFDVLYAREWPVEKLLVLEAQAGLNNFNFLARLIRQGIADGSLRRDLHPTYTLHAVLNAVIGVQRRFAVLGDKVEEEFGQPVDRLFRETLRILLQGMAAPAGVEAPQNKAHPSKRKGRAGN
jgi:AcrR family transcriptional regulator